MKTSALNENADEEKKKELLHTLEETKDLGSRLSEKGRELVAAGQNAADWAEITIEALPLLNSNQALERIGGSWKYTNIQISQALDQLGNIDISTMQSTSTGSAITSLLSVPIIINPELGAASNTTIQVPLEEHISEQTRKEHDKDIVTDLMKLLKLDTASAGRRTPLEQLETAYKAFEITIDGTAPAATSLIPLRQCILQVLDILLKKRIHQEPAGNAVDKVISILNQLKRDSVAQQRINELSQQCKEILDSRLSPSKDAKLARPEWRHALVISVLWLKSFLLAIDQEKIR